MNAARAEKGDDVEGVLFEGGLDVLPAGVVEHAPRLQGDVDKGGTLGDNLTSAKRVVANLLLHKKCTRRGFVELSHMMSVSVSWLLMRCGSFAIKCVCAREGGGKLFCVSQ